MRLLVLLIGLEEGGNMKNIPFRLPPGKLEGEEYTCLCPNPLCPNRSKFQFNLEKMVGHCFRCNFTISGEKQAARVFGQRGNSFAPFQIASITKDAKLPTDLQPAMWHNDRAGVEYLERRYVPENLMTNIFYSHLLKMLYFPTVPVDCRHKPTWQRRSIEDGKGWMSISGVEKDHHLYSPVDGILKDLRGRTVILVEGPFDVLTPCFFCPSWAYYAVSLLGSALYRPQLHALVLAGVARVVAWMDPDDAGRKATKEIEKEFGSYGIPVMDMNAMGGWEPGDACKVPDPIPRLVNAMGWRD